MGVRIGESGLLSAGMGWDGKMDGKGSHWEDTGIEYLW